MRFISHIGHWVINFFKWWFKEGNIQLEEKQESVGFVEDEEEITEDYEIETNNQDLEKLEERVKERCEELEKQISKIDERLSGLFRIHRELAEGVSDSVMGNVETEDLEKLEEKISDRFNRDTKVYNKNFNFINSKIKKLEEKFDYGLEIFAERLADKEQSEIAFPSIFEKRLTLADIYRRVKNKNSASLLALVHLMKKQLEDKGVRL